MKANIVETRDKKEIRFIKVEIENEVYTIKESVDKKLVVNKSDGTIAVFPRYSNEIEIK